MGKKIFVLALQKLVLIVTLKKVQGQQGKLTYHKRLFLGNSTVLTLKNIQIYFQTLTKLYLMQKN